MRVGEVIFYHLLIMIYTVSELHKLNSSTMNSKPSIFYLSEELIFWFRISNHGTKPMLLLLHYKHTIIEVTYIYVRQDCSY